MRSTQSTVAGEVVGWRTRFSRLRWTTLVACGLLTLHGILAWIGRAFGVTTGNDDAAYILLARSIREFSYRDLHLLGSPIHSQYPPGLPAILALISLPFGERFDLFLAVIVLFSVGALALLYDTIRRRCGLTVALTVLALCAVNPALVHYAGAIASETPYLFFTALTFWLVTREAEVDGKPGLRSWRWTAVITAAAIAAAVTRTIGVTMLAALFLVWLMERRYRRALTLALSVGLTAGAWLLWTIFAPGQVVGRSYIADATFGGAGNRPLFEVFIDRAVSSLPAYLASSLPTILPQPTIPTTLADNLLGLAVVLALGALGVKVLWGRMRLIVVYVLLYACVLLLWPYWLTRFLAPVAPLLLWLLLAGAFNLAIRRRWLRRVPILVGSTIFLTAITRDIDAVTDPPGCDRAAPTTSPGCHSDVQRAFFAAMTFIRDSTPDSAVFLTVKEATFGYLAERRAIAPGKVDGRSGADLLRSLRERDAAFIVLTPLREPQLQHVPALLEVCNSLEVVREFAPMTFVLRTRPASSAPSSAAASGRACAAVRRYQNAPVVAGGTLPDSD